MTTQPGRPSSSMEPHTEGPSSVVTSKSTTTKHSTSTATIKPTTIKATTTKRSTRKLTSQTSQPFQPSTSSSRPLSPTFSQTQGPTTRPSNRPTSTKQPPDCGTLTMKILLQPSKLQPYRLVLPKFVIIPCFCYELFQGTKRTLNVIIWTKTTTNY